MPTRDSRGSKGSRKRSEGPEDAAKLVKKILGEQYRIIEKPDAAVTGQDAPRTQFVHETSKLAAKRGVRAEEDSAAAPAIQILEVEADQNPYADRPAPRHQKLFIADGRLIGSSG